MGHKYFSLIAWVILYSYALLSKNSPRLLISPRSGVAVTPSTFAKENNVHIITGAFWGEEKVTNSVIVIDNEGKCYEEIYNKRHLIPFTELTSLTDNKIKKGKKVIKIIKNKYFPPKKYSNTIFTSSKLLSKFICITNHPLFYIYIYYSYN